MIRILLAVLAAGLLLTDARVEAADGVARLRGRFVELYTGRAVQGRAHRTAAMAALQAEVETLIARQAEADEPRPPQPAKLAQSLTQRSGEILAMALAYRTPDSGLHRSQKLLLRIQDKLRQLLPQVRPGSPRPGGFFHWGIGIPMRLGPALVLLGDDLDPQFRTEGRTALEDLLDYPLLNGANALWQLRNNVYLALLYDDDVARQRLDAIYRDVLPELTAHESWGIVEDYSFQFHGRQVHTRGYGAAFAECAAEMIYMAEGGPWTVPEFHRRLLGDHLVEHVRWVLVGDTYDFSVRGRVLARPESAERHLSAMLVLLATEGPQPDGLTNAAQQLLSHWRRPLSLSTGTLADRLPQTKPVPLLGFRHFYVSDLAVFRAPDFYASVKMFSERTIDYEALHGANETGWFLGYGLTYITRTGDELYRDPATLGEHFDWDRPPGTTTRVGVRPDDSKHRGVSRLSGGAGCPPAEGQHHGGVCGFILKPVTGDFTARKSVHFFERGVVALGSDITSSKRHPGQPIVTTVLQWAAPEADAPLRFSGDRVVGPFDGERSWQNVSWAWFDGVGLWFPEPVTLHGHRRGKLATLWLDHGDDPKAAAYAYVVLPACESPDAVVRFAGEPTVAVRRCDEEMHAVENLDDHSMTLAVWRSGRVDDIIAHHPSMLHVRPGADGIQAAAATAFHFTGQTPLSFGLEQRPKQLLFKLPSQASGHPRGPGLVFNLKTVPGRIYCVAVGDVPLPEQPPHLDVIPFAEQFRIVRTETEGPTTLLTFLLPDAAVADGARYRMEIRSSLGLLRHRLAPEERVDLTPTDTASKMATRLVRYRWIRSGPKTTDGDFIVVLNTEHRQAVEHFTVPAQAGQPRQPLEAETDEP